MFLNDTYQSKLWITFNMLFQVCQQWPLLQRLAISRNGLGKKPDFSNDLVSGYSQLQELDLSDSHFIDSQKVLTLNLNTCCHFKIPRLNENHFTLHHKEIRNVINHVAE